MKTNPPNIKHIRCDINLSSLGNKLTALNATMESLPVVGFDDNKFWFGVKWRIIVYRETKENEVLGYTGETRAFVFEKENKETDAVYLERYLYNAFINVQIYLQTKAPTIRLSMLGEPDYRSLSLKIADLLEDIGLYSK